MKRILLTLPVALVLAACATPQVPPIVQVPIGICPVAIVPARPSYLTENLADDATVGEVLKAFAADLETAIGHGEDLESRLKPYSKQGGAL